MGRFRLDAKRKLFAMRAVGAPVPRLDGALGTCSMGDVPAHGRVGLGGLRGPKSL